MNALLSNPLETVILGMTALLVVALVISAISNNQNAVEDIADAAGKPLEGLGLGIESLFKGIGDGILAILSGIGTAIVSAVDNITSAAAIQGIITAICNCF